MDEGDDETTFNDLKDLWDSFAQLWEKEFTRLSRNEEVHQSRVAAFAELAAEFEEEAYVRSVEDKVRAGDAAARRESQRCAAQEESRQNQAVARVASDAEQRRIEATRAAMEDMDALIDEAARRSAAKREEREARRREARRERQAATNARFKPGEAAGASNDRPRPSAEPPRASAPAAERVKAQVPVAPKVPGWKDLEARMQEGAELSLADVPWPPAPPATVSGMSASDPADVKKRKLRAAVLRWHPDKWSPALQHFPAADQPVLLNRVKDVTQRILEEKRRFCQDVL